ncbi:SRPBCC family protein [Micromonospora pattaloongensis]|nr:SRPBCC family protein [Micromonospora pattaloongensis]
MAVVEEVMPVPPARVFAVLKDGWTYGDWVVGTAHIRDVDADWPRPGSSLHHKAGPWPFSLKDKSTVVSCDEPHQLTICAGVWPTGEATVEFRLAPTDGGGTRVTLAEDFSAGPLGAIWNRANDLVLYHRNRETLRRLADLATHGWGR